MTPRKLFVAGATGETGRALVQLARARGVPLVAQVRPRRVAAAAPPDGSTAVDLEDAAALQQALRGCTTVVQLIGTMRARFAQGDTYESSDVGTTARLADAARAAGADHFILLSSVGAGRPVGAYLQAKARAERIVRESGLAWTVLRPSAFEGGRHRAPPGLGLVARLPGLDALAPVAVLDLAAALLHCALERAPLQSEIGGRALQALVRAAQEGTSK